jgi:hypothetical protein
MLVHEQHHAVITGWIASGCLCSFEESLDLWTG